MENNKSSFALLWLIILLFALSSIGTALVPLSSRGDIFTSFGAASLLTHLLLLSFLAFPFIHGAKNLGLKNILVFFALTFVISWSYETLSIHTGFPFGHYKYTSNLGPKLGSVPIVIMFAYFTVLYPSWVIAHVLLDRFDLRVQKGGLFTVPIIAAFIMAMWDLTFDPTMATIHHDWIWENGGAYFGVPFKNFLGWYLCVYTILQVTTFYLKSQTGKMEEHEQLRQVKTNWLLPILFYAFLVIKPFHNAIYGVSTEIESKDGHHWWTGDIYQTLALAAIFTMGFVVVLSLIKLKTAFESE